MATFLTELNRARVLAGMEALSETKAFDVANQKSFIIARLRIGYMSDKDDEDEVTVTIYTECSSKDEAIKLVAKMKENMDDCEGVCEDNNDFTTHIAFNTKYNFMNILGAAYIESVKITDKEPKLTSKTFHFDPEDLGF